MKLNERFAQGEWFDAVVARMLVEDPRLGPDVAVDVAEEVSRLPRWRELSPEIAAHRAALRLAGIRAVDAAANEPRKARGAALGGGAGCGHASAPASAALKTVGAPGRT